MRTAPGQTGAADAANGSERVGGPLRPGAGLSRLYIWKKNAKAETQATFELAFE